MRKMVTLGGLGLLAGMFMIAFWAANYQEHAFALGESTPTSTTSSGVTQPPRSESTNTPEVTATSTEAPPEDTATSVPPAATSTRAGGGVGGEIGAPDTGAGGGDNGSGATLWFLVIGSLVAVGGGATMAYGALRNR